MKRQAEGAPISTTLWHRSIEESRGIKLHLPGDLEGRLAARWSSSAVGRVYSEVSIGELEYFDVTGGRAAWLVTEFVEHYHGERNHQGLENRLLTAAMTPSNDRAPIVRRERLGGILNYYYRSAA